MTNKGYKKEADKTLPIGPGRGCKYAPDCTKCPFVDLYGEGGNCLYHLSPMKRESLFSKLDFRDEVIYKSFIAGRDAVDIAKVFKLSTGYIRSLIAKEYKKK